VVDVNELGEALFDLSGDHAKIRAALPRLDVLSSLEWNAA
jgi:hypothetical protein